MDLMDDDFGDLYADVEVHTTSAVPSCFIQSEDDYNHNDNNNDIALNYSPVEKSLYHSKKLDSGFDDSDSDDDLNILLNDDDGGNEEHDGGSFAVEKTGLNKNAIADGSELKSSGNGDKTENSQFSQLKYIRNHGSPFPSNMRVKGCIGIGTTSSSGRSDWDTNAYNHNKGGSVQYGYGFSLPWYRTILDINIDAFQEKPWRQPGVDITDFFNFGFDEGSWKQYCRLITPEVRSEMRGVTEKAPADDDTQLESLSRFTNGRENPLEVEKGRAIQVEGGIGERQPSMGVSFPHFRDSDVVIKILVQDSLLDSSSSHEAELGCTVREVSRHEDIEAMDNSHVIQDDVSSEHLKETIETVHVPSFQRSLQLKTESTQMFIEKDNHEDTNISDLGGHFHQKMSTCTTEEIAEAREGVSKEDGEVCINICDSDPCLIERQSSISSQNRLSLSSSYSGSDSYNRSEDSVKSDSIKIHSPLRRQSLDTGTELMESPSSGYTISISNDSKTKMVAGKPPSVHRSAIRKKQKYGDPRIYGFAERICHERDHDASLLMQARADRKQYVRGRSSVQETRRDHTGRSSHHAEEKIYPKNRKDIYPLLDLKALDDKDYLSVDGRRNESKLPDIGYYYRDSTRYRERQRSQGYHEGRFALSHHHTVSSKYSWAEADWSSRENLNQDIKKNNNKLYLLRKRGVFADNHCDGESNWHHGQERLSEGLVHYCYRGSRKLAFKFPSVYKERGSRWEREDDRFQPTKRTDHVGCPYENEYENYPLQDRDLGSVSLAEYQRDFQIRRYGECLPEIERKISVSRWRDWHSDTAFHLDGSWHMENEDEKWRLRANRRRWHCNISPQSEKYDLEFAKEFHGHKKKIFSEENKDYSQFGSHTDVYDIKDSIFYDDNQVDSRRRRYSWQSKIHRVEDNSILSRQDDRNAAEEESVLRERSSEHEMVSVDDGFGWGRMLPDNFQMEAHRYRRFTNCHHRNYNISSRSQRKQMLLNCRDANKAVGTGKCHGSHSYDRTLSDHRNEKMDMKFLKESSFNGLSDRKGARRAKTIFPNTKGNRNDEKELIKFPVIEQNEVLDIEEGQIVVEEETMGKKKHVLETAWEPCNAKTLQRDDSSGKQKAVREYDNDLILKSLAKMEKRRERFKDPVAVTKETDDTLKPLVQMVVDSDITKVKQERPARKRRWGSMT